MEIQDLILREAQEEEYTIFGKRVIIRRDDLRFRPPLPPNMKMEALFEIVKHAYVMGYKKVVMFAKKQQGISYAIGLPVFCEMFGLQPIVTIPKTSKQRWSDLPWVMQLGPKTETIALHPNMVSININQSKKIAKERGAYFIPFGFDSPLSIEAHAKNFQPNVEKIGTLITATMTGMILGGILKSIFINELQVNKIIGISCGRPEINVHKSIRQYIDIQMMNRLEIVNPYDRNIDALELVRFHNDYAKDKIPEYFHPDYEAKACLFMLQNIGQLQDPIYFVNVGR